MIIYNTVLFGIVLVFGGLVIFESYPSEIEYLLLAIQWTALLGLIKK